MRGIHDHVHGCRVRASSASEREGATVNFAPDIYYSHNNHIWKTLYGYRDIYEYVFTAPTNKVASKYYVHGWLLGVPLVSPAHHPWNNMDEAPPCKSSAEHTYASASLHWLKHFELCVEFETL